MNFKDQTECYGAIGAALASASPKGWRYIEAAITLEGLRVDALITYTDALGQQGYLTGIPRLASHFYDLARLVSTEEKGLYKNCVFKLYESGKYETQFGY
jgi:hypothetical protein